MKKLLIAVLLLSTTVKGYTLQDVYAELINQGVQNPKYVLSQCMLETGWLKSNLVKKGNNLFSMKHPTKRKTLSKGRYNRAGYAKYDSWVDAVKDYAIWQRTRYRPDEYYLDFLVRINYAEDPKYEKLVQRLYNKLTYIYEIKRIKMKNRINKLNELRSDATILALDVRFYTHIRGSHVDEKENERKLRIAEKSLSDVQDQINKIENEYLNAMVAEYKKQHPYSFSMSENSVIAKLNKKYDV